jgi:hypothetical protein
MINSRENRIARKIIARGGIAYGTANRITNNRSEHFNVFALEFDKAKGFRVCDAEDFSEVSWWTGTFRYEKADTFKPTKFTVRCGGVRMGKTVEIGYATLLASGNLWVALGEKASGNWDEDKELYCEYLNKIDNCK